MLAKKANFGSSRFRVLLKMDGVTAYLNIQTEKAN